MDKKSEIIAMLEAKYPPSDNFDFDKWVTLARTAPEDFNQQRGEWIEKTITGRAAGEARLRKIQWRIDAERRKARTPLKACLQLSSLMWDSFLELNNALNDKSLSSNPTATCASKPTSSARVLPFNQAMPLGSRMNDP